MSDATAEARVVIVDADAFLELGLTAILTEANIAVDDVEDLGAWVVEAGRRAVLVSQTQCSIREMIVELRAIRADLPIILLLGSDDAEAYAEAIAAGACSAVWREAPPNEFLFVLRSALRGYCVLPIRVAHHLAQPPSPPPMPLLSSLDCLLLQSLARGESVTDLAEEMSYSLRAMHRKLRALYTRIGAINRSDAIVMAAIWGIAAPNQVDVTVDLPQTERPVGPQTDAVVVTPALAEERRRERLT